MSDQPTLVQHVGGDAGPRRRPGPASGASVMPGASTSTAAWSGSTRLRLPAGAGEQTPPVRAGSAGTSSEPAAMPRTAPPMRVTGRAHWTSDTAPQLAPRSATWRRPHGTAPAACSMGPSTGAQRVQERRSTGWKSQPAEGEVGVVVAAVTGIVVCAAVGGRRRGGRDGRAVKLQEPRAVRRRSVSVADADPARVTLAARGWSSGVDDGRALNECVVRSR